MRIVGRQKLSDFSAKHANCRSWIVGWIAETEATQWSTPQDIKDRFSSASFLAGGEIIFNVKGNTARLVTRVAFKTSTVSIEWIGTHAEYTKIYG